MPESTFVLTRTPTNATRQSAEVTALAWKWFLRLTERGKDVENFVSTFATYVARAVRNGRRVCGQQKSNDVLSPSAQQRHRFAVQRLPDFETLSANPFSEALAENTVTPPDEQAAFRLDFASWLCTRTTNAINGWWKSWM